jgi:uncharacterized protein YgbK (DUF1537 family)
VTRPLPFRVLAYYGDDFTGSTDVMEAMTLGGLETVLFLAPPSPEDLARFPTARAIGVAGTSRSQTPEWMDRNLPAIFRALAALKTPLLQYKICSTFDSSPAAGSIGRALEIGRRTLGCKTSTPIVVGAPALGRYLVFGNLFASVDGETFRLDRHPTMARHPVTPMGEADLARHLASQTTSRVGRFDVLALAADDFEQRFASMTASDPDAVLFDTLDNASLERTGWLVWEACQAQTFCVASSGLNYALIAAWRLASLVGPAEPLRPALPVDRIAVASGSCSPATARQIGFAIENGFAPVPADARKLAHAADAPSERARIEVAALQALAEGRSPVIYTALGPDDPAVAAYHDFVAKEGLAPEGANERVGSSLGEVTRSLVIACKLKRAILCGGDTSGHAARSLGISALTLRTPIAPGSPLCTAHSTDVSIDGLEIALKGGQVGKPNYFLAGLIGHA